MKSLRPFAWPLFLCLVLPAVAVPSSAGETTVRGWVEAPGLPDDLRRNITVLDQREHGIFVEIPVGLVGVFERRGVLFRETPEAWTLSVGGERFDVRGGEPPLQARWKVAEGSEGTRPFVVKFHAPPGQAWQEELERRGAKMVQYLPSFGYLVQLSEGAEKSLARWRHVEFIGEYHPAYKAMPSLRELADQDLLITLRVIFFDLPGWQEELQRMTDAGGRVVNRSRAAATSQRQMLHYIILENVSTRDLPAILSHRAVYWAERWSPPHLEGERAAQVTAGNITGGHADLDYYSWLTSIGADGGGVTVAIADTGLDTGDPSTIHADFFGRVTFASAICPTHEDLDGHGTNVASIAVGDPRAISSGTGSLDGLGFHWGGGSAPGSHLYFQRALASGCFPASGAVGLGGDAVGVGGAHIGSHSFTDGLGDGASYNSQAQAWDAVVRDADPNTAGNQPYSVIFSAGNSGTSGLTSPKAAKNIVTVGATKNDRPGECPGVAGCGGSADDIDQVVDFSSRGPAEDGRVKPDVVVPGHVVAGAASSVASYGCTCDGPGGASGCCDSEDVDDVFLYTRFSGTSQASPRVAGASAVVYDWFENLTSALPSPAMNKAILINSAVDLKAPDVPNNVEGWGRVSLRDVLQASEGVQFVDQSSMLGATGDGSAFTATYYIQDMTQPMKATLVWTDAPGAINCNPCLVNDLDLLVTSGGTTWRGNNLVNGFSTIELTADSINNVEVVLIAPGAPDCSFEVKVRAQTLSGDGVPGNADATDQDFALVVRNAGTAPGPPQIFAESSQASAGCDGDEFVDRGEVVDITLDIKNCGSMVTGLDAVLTVLSAPAGAAVGISPMAAQAISDLAPGMTTQAIWQLSLDESDTDFCGEELKLEVEVSDGGSQVWQDNVTVFMDAESLVTTPNVDFGDSDLSFSADSEWSIQSCRTTSASTSWHMGQTDCTGIVRDSSERSLVFRYVLAAGTQLRELSFQHAFDGYGNVSLMDTVTVEIDHDADGIFTILQTWSDGVDNPTTMSPAGPYDLSGFNADRAGSVDVRFRFRSGANWVGGPNTALGWDVDDITLIADVLDCDPQTCVSCQPAPPAVPDGTADGSPMTVAHSGDDLLLSWDTVAGATVYNVYAGTMGIWYSHDGFLDVLLDGGQSCAEPSNSVTLTMPAGDVYFLVTSDSGCKESSYGVSSGGPRPVAAVPCNPQ